jgi:hypothetical protein
LLLNDDTIRDWLKLFEQRGIEGLTSFDMGGSELFERRAGTVREADGQIGIEHEEALANRLHEIPRVDFTSLISGKPLGRCPLVYMEGHTTYAELLRLTGVQVCCSLEIPFQKPISKRLMYGRASAEPTRRA